MYSNVFAGSPAVFLQVILVLVKKKKKSFRAMHTQYKQKNHNTSVELEAPHPKMLSFRKLPSKKKSVSYIFTLYQHSLYKNSCLPIMNPLIWLVLF